MDREGCSIGATRCVDLVRGMTDLNAQARESWADAPRHLLEYGELNYHEAFTFSEIVARAILVETDRGWTRSTFLSTFWDAADAGLAPIRLVDEVLSFLDGQNMDVSDSRRVEKLRAIQADQPSRFGPNTAPRPPDPAAGLVPDHGRPVGPRRLLDLLRGLTSTSPSERYTWADTARHWSEHTELDLREALTTATVTTWAAVTEPDPTQVVPAQLALLAALARRGLVATHTLRQLLDTITPADLAPTETASHHTLSATLARRHRPPGPADPPTFDTGLPAF